MAQSPPPPPAYTLCGFFSSLTFEVQATAKALWVALRKYGFASTRDQISERSQDAAVNDAAWPGQDPCADSIPWGNAPVPPKSAGQNSREHIPSKGHENGKTVKGSRWCPCAKNTRLRDFPWAVSQAPCRHSGLPPSTVRAHHLAPPGNGWTVTVCTNAMD